MDLGITGRNAIVCASSRGLGFASASALAREGVNVVINGRDAQTLAGVRERIAREHSVEVADLVGVARECASDIPGPSRQNP